MRSWTRESNVCAATATRRSSARLAAERQKPMRPKAASPDAPQRRAAPAPAGINASAAQAASAVPADVAPKLAKLGIRAWNDLILHLPLRYEDETRLVPLASAPSGEVVQVEATVLNAEVQYRPRRQLVVRVEDAGEELTLRFLHFYPSQLKQFTTGTRVRLLGEIRRGMFGAEAIHPRYRIVRGDVPLAATLTPVYPTTAGLAQHTVRALVSRALAQCDLGDTLPQALAAELKLPGFAEAVRFLHAPPPDVALDALEERSHPAWVRIKFDELLAQQLSMRSSYRRRRLRAAPALPARGHLLRKLLDTLPFALTPAQHRAVAQIRSDLARAHPMQRLLQGDVGSGKTVVAAAAALQAIENGWQVAVMAPTEILAEQHYLKFSAWLAPLGVEVIWIAGGQGKRPRALARKRLLEAQPLVAVGTHALIQDAVTFPRLALAIVDEQHRFGVRERLALGEKGSAASEPHRLMMSATPIPRTLAMSFYADLDVSVIDTLPPGRTPIATKLVSARRREEVFARVRDACVGGGQAYWVCPLIEESETLQLQTAIATHEAIQQAFPELTVGLVHGRLAPAEKADVMARFKGGEIRLLVATTVIEVGVDVPNATLMVIENAERMGLAQLHQLRGRVGRGREASVCILMYETPLSELARARLKIVYETADGFEIARKDLELRGPGELLGARQSGVPMLRFADLGTDLALLEKARSAAERMLELEPELARAHLERWFGSRHDYLNA
ncbi:MAG: ATP-dependent DNA helicase RecG [Betaproteobacteria bacterium]|nr:ATP-dependent DNA helicase RecG [Betaproteobacteria bacterium]